MAEVYNVAFKVERGTPFWDQLIDLIGEDFAGMTSVVIEKFKTGGSVSGWPIPNSSPSIGPWVGGPIAGGSVRSADVFGDIVPTGVMEMPSALEDA